MKTPLLPLLVALSFASAASTMVGCYDSDLCEFVTCTGDSTATATSSGPPVGEECNPLDPEKYAPSAECGVFVREGASGTGTPDDPMGSLVQALALDRGAVYVCKGTYAGSAELPAGATIFGGLSCDGWLAQPNERSVLAGDANDAALKVRSGNASVVHNLEIVAPDATGVDPVDGYGLSSVGVLARAGSAVTFRNCKIVANAGASGRAGIDSERLPAAVGGVVGKPGGEGCASTSSTTGGDGGVNLCDGINASGGRGGLGQNMSGGNGQPGDGGLPDGRGGAGGSGNGVGACNAGDNGDSGAYGIAAVADLSTGDANDLGFVPGSAAPGGVGQPGGGGGGGGGAKPCAIPLNNGGASGGGGGAGGCGGGGGQSGGAGGWSIGVLSVNATVSIERSEITTGVGGTGGVGGRGQLGGGGGSGGSAGAPASMTMGNNACPGGNGGEGGQGGPGAGGQGGWSIAILYKKAADGSVPVNLDTSFVLGMGALGGDGALNSSSLTTGETGATGTRCIALELGSDRECDQ